MRCVREDEDDKAPGGGGGGAADAAPRAAPTAETPPSTMPPYPDPISTAIRDQVQNILEAYQNKDQVSLRNSYSTAYKAYDI